MEEGTGSDRPWRRYRTRNWREYDRALVTRGDLTVWISPDLAWHAAQGMGRRGRPQVFTDAAISIRPVMAALKSGRDLGVF